MAFSPDSKYLLTQTSPPESNLVYWLWEKQKVMAMIRTDSQNNAAYQVPSRITSTMQVMKNSISFMECCVRATVLISFAFLNLVSQKPHVVCMIIIVLLYMR